MKESFSFALYADVVEYQTEFVALVACPCERNQVFQVVFSMVGSAYNRVYTNKFGFSVADLLVVD